MKRTILALVIAGTLTVPALAEAHTLTYQRAKRAAQVKGDQIAGQRTQVKTLIRQGRHSYYAQASWTFVDPTGCKGCVYDESTQSLRDGPITEYCFAALRVRFRSSRSRSTATSLSSRSCS